LDGEATATTGGRRHPRQQRRLGRTAHRLADPLEQDQRRRHRYPGNPQERGDGQQRDTDGRHQCAGLVLASGAERHARVHAMAILGRDDR
jgi:hypothetical protein